MTVMYIGSMTRPTPTSDRASSRKRKFEAECSDGELTIQKIIKRFPTMAASEMMKLDTTLMTKASSASGSERNVICIEHEPALVDGVILT